MTRLGDRSLRWEALSERLNVFAIHRTLYRALGGRLVGRNVLILTTTGRKTGRRRGTPVFFVRAGGDYVVIASNGGEDRFPGWWHNIRANPDIEIEVGRSRIACRAERVSGAEVPSLLAKLDRVYSGYARYAARTTRELTLFRLKPLRGTRS